MVPFLETDTDGKYAGYYSFWSGYSEYTVARDYEVMMEEGKGPGHPEFWDAYYTQQVLPDDIDPVEGVMIITFCEVLAAVRNFGFDRESRVAVFGAGPVGMTFIRLMKLLGVQTVISVDVLEEKRKEAKRAGADAFVNSSTEDVVQNIRRLVPEGVDYVLDAVGVNGIINTAMYLLKGKRTDLCIRNMSRKGDAAVLERCAAELDTTFFTCTGKGTAGRGISADCGVGASGKHNIRRLYLSQGTVFTDPGCV